MTTARAQDARHCDSESGAHSGPEDEPEPSPIQSPRVSGQADDLIQEIFSGDTSPSRTSRGNINAEEWKRVEEKAGIASGAGFGVDDDQVQKNSSIVDSFPFHMTMGSCICAYCVVIGIETDLEKTEHADSVVWDILEQLFCLIWVGEMITKICFLRWLYFASRWNWFDAMLVCLSVFEAWAWPLLRNVLEDEEIVRRLASYLKVMRTVRLLRLIRLMRMFKEMWTIVNGFVKALRACCWVLLLLVMVIYICAVYLTMSVGHACDTDFAWWTICEDLFGSVPQSMLTLFQVMTLDTWSTVVARPVMKVHSMLTALAVCN
eukprot:gnl/TRDRNA2_/TRDRNA2_142016_c1_seq2.p1 gnl/TRDRNA2_/TRDRNA2_142016_c1~~gnl/TRDRNA2_/TRDRNA2_142016_c1_seq2.p1  ORF type:complete len:319 (-),score=46.74 gnl/TRDRNA2_/TRDRNA2_142016_c1_seq2:4-960(-)